MEKLIYRPVLEKIKSRIEKNQIFILIGARQVGKTSIMLMLEKDLFDDNSAILFYDCEKIEYREIFSNYDTALAFIKGQTGDIDNKIFLFLDEFQKVPNIGNTLKLIADHNKNITTIASGSSSLEIKTQLQESLVGRKRVIEIFPLCFQEFLSFISHKEQNAFAEYVQDPKWPIYKLYEQAFKEYIIYGGLPRIAKEPLFEEKINELNEIYSSYLQKDIKSYIKEEKVVSFNKLLRLLAAQIGNLVSIDELAVISGLKRKEVEEFLYILEQTYIIFLLPPLHKNLRKEISKMKKIYFYDTGLRNIILNNFSDIDVRVDGGALFENVLIAEMIKQKRSTDLLYFWQTQQGTEVDLIIKRGEELIPIEIKKRLSSLKKLRGLKSFCELYKIDYAYVVTSEEPPNKAENIRFIPPSFISCLS